MRWSNIVHHGALQFDQQLLTQQYLDSQYPLLYFGTSPLTSWHVQPKGDSSVVLRETGARICMVPAAFPIPRPCLVVAQLPVRLARRRPPPGVCQRQTELSRNLVNRLACLVYEVSLRGQRSPRLRVDVAGLGMGRSVRFDGWECDKRGCEAG